MHAQAFALRRGEGLLQQLFSAILQGQVEVARHVDRRGEEVSRLTVAIPEVEVTDSIKLRERIIRMVVIQRAEVRAAELRQEGDELLIAHTLGTDRLTSLGKARKLSNRQSGAPRGLRYKILRIRGDVADIELLQMLLSGSEILTASLGLRKDTSIDIIGMTP